MNLIDNFVTKTKMNWVRDYRLFYDSLVSGQKVDCCWLWRQRWNLVRLYFSDERKEALFEIDDVYNHLFPYRTRKVNKYVTTLIDFYRQHDRLPDEPPYKLEMDWFNSQMDRQKKEILPPTEHRAIFRLYTEVAKLDYTRDLRTYVQERGHLPGISDRESCRLSFWVKCLYEIKKPPPELEFDLEAPPRFVDKLVAALPELPLSFQK